MKRLLTGAGMGFVALALASLALAAAEQKAKSGPVAGTWEGTSHGGGHQEGDTPFTLDLEQDGEKVTGSVSSPQGGMEITSATFKDDLLEIHLDTPDGNYVLKATLKEGQLKGDTTLDGNPKGTWEGKKSAPAGDSKSGGSAVPG